MNRHQFLKQVAFTCLAPSILASVLQGCAAQTYFAKAAFNNNIIALPKSEFNYLDNGVPKQRAYVLLKNEGYQFPICVFKINENTYSAILMECTHSSCELHNQGNYLLCPCHGSEFSNLGVVQNPPAEQDLKIFKTQIDTNIIYVQL